MSSRHNNKLLERKHLIIYLSVLDIPDFENLLETTGGLFSGSHEHEPLFSRGRHVRIVHLKNFVTAMGRNFSQSHAPVKEIFRVDFFLERASLVVYLDSMAFG